ncbi:MAG: hypothetical protein BGO14_08805 [Chlamydiales bacterium 38-26]|nr:hypothetical protein [Chlamydiales bacterium]OJV11083.1 MAG: hypothetical protein BGO14_08805 [Chlamydiales bacterium 38-26]
MSIAFYQGSVCNHSNIEYPIFTSYTTDIHQTETDQMYYQNDPELFTWIQFLKKQAQEQKKESDETQMSSTLLSHYVRPILDVSSNIFSSMWRSSKKIVLLIDSCLSRILPIFPQVAGQKVCQNPLQETSQTELIRPIDWDRHGYHQEIPRVVKNQKKYSKKNIDRMGYEIHRIFLDLEHFVNTYQLDSLEQFYDLKRFCTSHQYQMLNMANILKDVENFSLDSSYSPISGTLLVMNIIDNTIIEITENSYPLNFPINHRETDRLNFECNGAFKAALFSEIAPLDEIESFKNADEISSEEIAFILEKRMPDLTLKIKNIKKLIVDDISALVPIIQHYKQILREGIIDSINKLYQTHVRLIQTDLCHSHSIVLDKMKSYNHGIKTWSVINIDTGQATFKLEIKLTNYLKDGE